MNWFLWNSFSNAQYIKRRTRGGRKKILFSPHEKVPCFLVCFQSGFTPLHIAAHYGNVNIANLLLDRGANVNFAASKHNITPLHVAAKWGRANMVTLLLERGAEMDAKTRVRFVFMSPKTAATKNKPIWVELFLEGSHFTALWPHSLKFVYFLSLI